MRIGVMDEAETDAVSDVLCACYRWLAPREGYTPEQVGFLLKARGSPETVRRESQEQLYLVAREDGEVVGMTSVAGNQVTKLYVTPSRHRRGIGTGLLSAAEAAIRDAGLGTMCLGTTPGAVAFYERMGMTVAGRRRPRAGPFTDREVVLMEKALARDAGA